MEEEERVGKDKGEAIAAAAAVARDDKNDGSLLAQVKGGEEGPTSKKSKSCKGCLYYSSNLKSDCLTPLCVGITRSLPQVPRYIVGESESEASKVGRSFTDFKYGCVGYSVYSDTKEDNHTRPQPQTHKPAHNVGDEFLKRFTRNAGVVATGVAKNVHKVGNQLEIKSR